MQTSATEQPLNKTAEVRRLSKEAKQFYAEAEKVRGQVETGAMDALEKAWQCGKRLNAIKLIVGHGNWEAWRESQLPDLNYRNAQRYMKIARDNSKATRVSDLKFDSIRKHCLTFVPEKAEPNKHRDISFPRSVSLGNIINEYNRLKYRHLQGLQLIDFDRVREETVGLYEWLQFIHGDRDGDPWSTSKDASPGLRGARAEALALPPR
jgi:hypothetical protein